MKKAIKWLDKNFEVTMMAILLAALTSVMLAEIFLRILRIGSVKWGLEFCQYCFVYSTFFAIPYCISADSNLKIDVIINMLPAKIKKAVEVISAIVNLAFWAYMFYHAINVFTQSLAKPQYSTTMGFSLAWIYGIPMVTFALAVIREIQHGIKVVANKEKQQLTKEEEAELLNEAAMEDLKGEDK